MLVNPPTVVARVAPGATGIPVPAVRWTVGQLLTAQVIGATQGNYTRLAVGGTEVSARSSLPLQAGERLALRVTALTPEVVLRIEAATPSPAAAAARALARTLPYQASLGETARLMQALRHAAQAPVSNHRGPAAGTTALRGAANVVLAGQAHARDVSEPAGLRRAVEHAARPLEARLAAPPTPDAGELARDLRLGLTRLAHALPEPGTPRRDAQASAPTPPRPGAAPPMSPRAFAPTVPATPQGPVTAIESRPPGPASREAPDTLQLRALLEGAVTRLKALQLQNLPAAAGQPPTLTVELPLVHDTGVDWLRFAFEGERPPERSDADAKGRSERGDAGDDVRATVTIRLIGHDERDVAARVRLNGDHLAIRVGSSNTELHARIAAEVDTLRAAIERHGYVVDEIGAGSVDVDTRPRRDLVALVDTRA